MQSVGLSVHSRASKRALRSHRLLLRFALGASIFAWLFVFQFFYDATGSTGSALLRVAALYLLAQTIVTLATPLAARLLSRGARPMLIAASLIAALSFALLGSAFDGLWPIAYVPAAIVCFGVGVGLYRALYWVPYTLEEHAARGAATFEATVIALAPAIAGLLVAGFPSHPSWLLYGAAAIMAVSAVALLPLGDLYEEFSWGYRRTFHELVDPANREAVRVAFYEGVAGAGLLLFWPIAIFLLTGWSYGVVGVIFALTFFVALFLRGLVRRGLKRVRLHDARVLGFVFAVTPWLFRLVVASPIGVVLVDSYFYTTAPRRLGIDPFVFEQSADGGTLLDERTALKEISLSLGRMTTAALGALVALYASLPAALTAVFIVAAIAAGALSARIS